MRKKKIVNPAACQSPGAAPAKTKTACSYNCKPSLLVTRTGLEPVLLP